MLLHCIHDLHSVDIVVVVVVVIVVVTLRLLPLLCNAGGEINISTNRQLDGGQLTDILHGREHETDRMPSGVGQKQGVRGKRKEATTTNGGTIQRRRNNRKLGKGQK